MTKFDEDESREKRAKLFCVRTFRKEIKGSETLKSLKRFISASQKSDEDIPYQYLECGGSIFEILSLIDMTAKQDLTTALPVFEVIHIILLRFQASDSRYHQLCLDGARSILNSHLLTIHAMLSMNVTKQKKVALKLLTAIVTLHYSFASEIMNVVSLSPSMITDLIQLSPEKESVRKYFILFILSFLIEGNPIIIKNLIEKKGYLSSIIPGLKFDESATVNLVLSLLEDKILKNTKIPKTVKLKLFNTQIIKSLFDLYDWKGPRNVKELLPIKKNKVKVVEVSETDKNLVVQSVHSFLIVLCSSKKYGVAFFDKSLWLSDKVSNQLLLTVFESLSDPLKNKKIAEVLTKTLATCPDLTKPVLLKLEPYFQPRNSKNWMETVDFAENLIKATDGLSILQNSEESPTANQIIKVAKNFCAPMMLLRNVKVGADKSQPVEIRLSSLRLLQTMWEETQKLLTAYKKEKHNLKKSVIQYFSKFLPDAAELVKLWHNLCNVEFVMDLFSTSEKIFLFLSTVLSSIQIILECQRDLVSSPLDLASNMLNHVETVKESMTDLEYNSIVLKIVQFVEMDLESLTPEMELFEKSLLILLQSSDEVSLSCASKILASTRVFKRNISEIDVWLSSFISLPLESRDYAAQFLINSLRNTNISMRSDVEMEGLSGSSLTPFVFQCIDLLERSDSESPEKVKCFKNYLCDATIHLQHFYAININLYEDFKPYRATIGKTLTNYLKDWMNNSLKSSDLSLFSCHYERDLTSWLLNEDDQRKMEDVIDIKKVNLLKLYSLFKIVVAHLSSKAANEDMKSEDVPKYVESLTFLLRATESEEDFDDGNDVLISNDLQNRRVVYRNCIRCLFHNRHLLRAFDVFSKRTSGSFYCTVVVIKVLMKNESVRRFPLTKSLEDPWRSQFLRQLTARLKKSKPIDKFDNLESVLNFFQFEKSDAATVIDFAMAVSDLNLFVHGTVPSKWALILVKFVKVYCHRVELTEDIVRKLCSILKHLSENCSELKIMDDCFIHILRKHPRHLILIENDFLEVILQRTDVTASTSILGKLLLNDPNKVRYFLKIAAENLENRQEFGVIMSLLPALIIKQDSFLNLIKSEDACLVWESSKIEQNTSTELFKLLEIVYKKIEDDILRVLVGDRKEKNILENLELMRELIRLFMDKKSLKKLKKEIIKGHLHPDLVLEVVKKFNSEEFIEVYVQGLLSLFCQLINDGKKSGDDTDLVWDKYCSIVSDVIKLKKDSPWENVIKSSMWVEFPKLALGFCLSSSKNHSLMRILRMFISSFYESDKDSKDLALLFQMVISHSQFLNVILGGFPLKSEVVQLLLCLLERTKSEISSKHVPVFLASYNASLSDCDKALVKILKLYESNGATISDYEPFVWGETAISHYSIGTSPGLSLWQRFSMANVLDLLDVHRMEMSLKEFPIHRDVEPSEIQKTTHESTVYDPAFLLPLFVNLLSPGSVVFCLPFIYKGALAYTIRSLSSERPNVRKASSVVLTRFYNHLEMSQKLKQKLVWMHFIDCFRYGIKDISVEPVSNIVSLFFARMTLELSSQPEEMFQPLQNFLLAKPYFVFDSVPEFLPLFHSSEVSYWKHRQWLLETLRDGTKTTLDLNVIFRSMSLKVLLCFYQSQLCDNETRKLVLQVLEKMLKVEKSILLISEYGLLNWINSIQSNFSPTIAYDLLNLLYATSNAIIKDIKFNKSKHTNLSHVVQVLNIAMKFLSPLETLKSKEVFQIYLKIVFECIVLFVKVDKVGWFKSNKNKLNEIISVGKNILGEEFDCNKFNNVPFYFRNYDELSSEIGYDLKKLVFIFNMLINK